MARSKQGQARPVPNPPGTLNSMQRREALNRYNRNEADIEELANDYDVDEAMIRKLVESSRRPEQVAH